MILADTSVWVDHWKLANLSFARLLTYEQVVMHPFVLGELATGSIRNRHKTLLGLRRMDTMRAVPHDAVLDLIESRRLFSRGIGYIDLRLLAAALANPPVKILTRDRRFRQAAEDLGVAA